jgi:hypothetical protein
VVSTTIRLKQLSQHPNGLVVLQRTRANTATHREMENAMRDQPTRRSWLKRLLGGLFSLGAAGAAGGQAPPKGQPPVGSPVPSLPLFYRGDPVLRVTTCVYDAAVPLAVDPSCVTTVVYDTRVREPV